MPVRAGESVYLGWATANLDAETFPNPLEVKLDRKDNRHVAFAAGIHRCLGSHLARLELRTAIDEFHQRIARYWVTEGAEPKYDGIPVRQTVFLPLSFARAT